jgi:hypothetical protein
MRVDICVGLFHCLCVSYFRAAHHVRGHVGVFDMYESSGPFWMECVFISTITMYVYLRIRVSLDHCTLLDGSRHVCPISYIILSPHALGKLPDYDIL